MDRKMGGSKMKSSATLSGVMHLLAAPIPISARPKKGADSI